MKGEDTVEKKKIIMLLNCKAPNIYILKILTQNMNYVYPMTSIWFLNFRNCPAKELIFVTITLLLFSMYIIKLSTSWNCIEGKHAQAVEK